MVANFSIRRNYPAFDCIFRRLLRLSFLSWYQKPVLTATTIRLLNRGSGHISGLSFGCRNLRAQKPLRGNFCQNNKAGFIRQPQAG
jgi:hypothetical protein